MKMTLFKLLTSSNIFSEDVGISIL